MGMANKADCLQKGELVKFQVCTVAQTGQKMACNVVPQRRAMVECVKDQVIIYSFSLPLLIHRGLIFFFFFDIWIHIYQKLQI